MDHETFMKLYPEIIRVIKLTISTYENFLSRTYDLNAATKMNAEWAVLNRKITLTGNVCDFRPMIIFRQITNSGDYKNNAFYTLVVDYYKDLLNKITINKKSVKVKIGDSDIVLKVPNTDGQNQSNYNGRVKSNIVESILGKGTQNLKYSLLGTLFDKMNLKWADFIRLRTASRDNNSLMTEISKMINPESQLYNDFIAIKSADMSSDQYIANKLLTEYGVKLAQQELRLNPTDARKLVYFGK